VGLGATYRITKQPYSWLPLLETEWTAGWKMNLKKPERNFPYAQGSLSWNVRFSDRFTWASLMKGTVLFDNDYEFYQAATIDLRGFRDNRFIGKQSFYQYSDLRLDMGKLKNPFTPLKYGLFAGFDYGRVWFPGERSHSWHTSYGGGIWLTFLNKFTTKYSWFGSTDSFRFAFELGLGF
jgi:hemolysin activation/secretion protein